MHFSCDSKGTEYTPEQAAERLDNAAAMRDLMNPICREFGYALASHGTNIRDIDLVAVPWTHDAKPHIELILELASRLILTLGPYKYDNPHGRFSIAMFHSWQPTQQIDLSIMPVIKIARVPPP